MIPIEHKLINFLLITQSKYEKIISYFVFIAYLLT